MKFLTWTLCSTLIFFACKEPLPNPVVYPNIIIIFADDLGYGDLGCFGHPTIQSPHIDNMAQEGLKLTQFYAAASICTPSRAGLLTGKLPARMGMYGKRSVLFPDSDGGLPTTETTLAAALKTRQYQTACIGKWHLGHMPQYSPLEHGFDYFWGIPYSNDMSPDNSNWDYAKENFPPLPLMEGKKMIEQEPDQRYLTRNYTEKAIAFIEENKGHPFFLYLPHHAPHTPLHVSDGSLGKSKRGLYGDAVNELDESVGEILNALKRLQLAQKTFVLFTSDNGPWGWAGINGGSAGLLKGAKGSPWEGGFRVPAIAWMPGTIPPNKTTDAIATTLDLYPTCLGMAGIKDSSLLEVDGKDIWATFESQAEVQDQVFYYRNEKLVAFRKGTWKIFIQNPNPWNDEIKEEDLPLLYNIDQDPSEKYNQAQNHPGIVAELLAMAHQHQSTVPKTPSLLDGILPAFQENHDAYYRKDQIISE